MLLFHKLPRKPKTGMRKSRGFSIRSKSFRNQSYGRCDGMENKLNIIGAFYKGRNRLRRISFAENFENPMTVCVPVTFSICSVKSFQHIFRIKLAIIKPEKKNWKLIILYIYGLIFSSLSVYTLTRLNECHIK